jgi:O-antigen ligase
LTALLGAAVFLFGGVYFWSAALLAGGLAACWLLDRPAFAGEGPLLSADRALVAILIAIGLQLLPVPVLVLDVISPGRLAYARAARLDGSIPGMLPLTLDRAATLHAWLAAFCTIATFWVARSLFTRGGIRTVITSLAWLAVAVVLVAVAQSAADTPLVYGFWRPYDAGARPLGPFINRNHAGTWSLLALMLCFGCLQWRRASTSAPPGRSWQKRLVQAMDGRTVILILAIVLLAVHIAAGASRSTMLALACAAGYVAWAAPGGTRRRGYWIRIAALGIVAALALVSYADLDVVLSRIDETRQLGFSGRIAIWQDTLRVIRDFPLAGAGAGTFADSMRVYQTSERTYYWNEAHNQYLQIAAEGGLMLAIPAAIAAACLAAAGRRRLSAASADPLAWMRLGAAAAILGVAVQAIFETGLALPANGMLAAVAAAILVHEPRVSPNAAAGH